MPPGRSQRERRPAQPLVLVAKHGRAGRLRDDGVAARGGSRPASARGALEPQPAEKDDTDDRREAEQERRATGRHGAVPVATCTWFRPAFLAR